MNLSGLLSLIGIGIAGFAGSGYFIYEKLASPYLSESVDSLSPEESSHVDSDNFTRLVNYDDTEMREWIKSWLRRYGRPGEKCVINTLTKKATDLGTDILPTPEELNIKYKEWEEEWNRDKNFEKKWDVIRKEVLYDNNLEEYKKYLSDRQIVSNYGLKLINPLAVDSYDKKSSGDDSGYRTLNDQVNELKRYAEDVENYCFSEVFKGVEDKVLEIKDRIPEEVKNIFSSKYSSIETIIDQELNSFKEQKFHILVDISSV